MKKLFLIMAVAVLTFSLNCCSSSTSSRGSLTFKLDGVEKKFKVEAEEVDGMVEVYGFLGTSDVPTESIDFFIDPGATGDVISGFTYSNADDYYYSNSATSDVTVNNGSSVKGTFSGSLNAPGGSTKTVTQGTFDVSY